MSESAEVNELEDTKEHKDVKKHESHKKHKKHKINYGQPEHKDWWAGDKNIDSYNKYKKGVSVFACQSDTTHPKVLELALGAGLLTKERYDILVNKAKGEKPILDKDELPVILEHYFGFNKGIYEENECEGIQKTKFGKTVAGEYRYMGEERTDKEWCNSGLASQEVKEMAKYGSVVTMQNNGGGVGELCIDDVFGSGGKDSY